MTQHSPSPWRVIDGAVYIKNARIVQQNAEFGGQPTDVRNANARLIAAAPELLEALKILRTQFGDYRDGDGAAKLHACNIADEAIAKATGKIPQKN